MKTEGLSFPEVVERLASEAGRRLPKPSAATTVRRSGQTSGRGCMSVLEASAAWFEAQLQGAGGAGGAPLHRAAWAQARDDRGIPPGFRAGGPVGAEGASGEPGLHAAGDGRLGHADRGRGHSGALRPLPQPRDVSDPRPQGPGDRFRRAGARSGCAGQVSELAGDAALSQGRRAVQRRQARQAGVRARSDHRGRRLHGRAWPWPRPGSARRWRRSGRR